MHYHHLDFWYSLNFYNVFYQKHYLNLVEKMKETNKLQVPTEGTEVEEDPRLQLFQKFSELKEAFETNNRNYFQIDGSDSNEEAI
jgi:hypothetical protein